MYARDIKSINIDGSVFHLVALDGVATWTYASGQIITHAPTLTVIQSHA